MKKTKSTKPRKPRKSAKKDSKKSKDYFANSVSAKVEVKRAVSGLGLFSAEPLKKGDFVIEYKGTPMTFEEAEYHPGKYLFEISTRVTINGASRNNTARYINHSCKPNCDPDVKKGRVLIFTTRAIKKGEEFTYDYGKEYFDQFLKPGGCKCPACLSKSKSKSK